MDVGKDQEDNEDLKDDDMSQEPAFMPVHKGHQDDRHSQELNFAAMQHHDVGAGSTGGHGGMPLRHEDEDEEEEEETAWAVMDRETETLILAELHKAEESLYAPLPVPATPLEAQSSLPANNSDNNDNNDDPEAQFWAMHRAQQAETERKALEKKANFLKEWSSAFVHLRVVGRAVPPPSLPRPPLSNLQGEEEDEIFAR